MQNVPEEVSADATPGDNDGNAAVTETTAEGVLIESAFYQPAGPKGLVVAGELQNRSDQVFEEADVKVTLYDENETTDEILDSESSWTEHDERLNGGNMWQWAVTFEEQPTFPVDYFSVMGRAELS